MDRGAWQATVHRIAELDTTERLTQTHTHSATVKIQQLVYPTNKSRNPLQHQTSFCYITKRSILGS